jgi:LemA protein
MRAKEETTRMSTSLVFWIAAAVLLFWSVGAYNRLIRLRASALQAFAALYQCLLEQAAVVRDCLPGVASLPEGPDKLMDEEDLQDDMTSLWRGLAGASLQFTASLAAARLRPLAPEAIAALHVAQGVLHMAWQRLQADDAHDLAGAALPETLQNKWQQSVADVQIAVQAFNLAVQTYNDAIAQFPALLLAWLFSLRRARALMTPVNSSR